MALPKTLGFTLLSLTPQVAAWGALGHETVAYIAQNFVSDETASFTQKILKNSSESYLAGIASWADSYRKTDEGAFSSPLHYIDALDSPPENCNMDFERDCPEEGCIVSAIANYTERVQDPELSLDEKQKALKWVVHFLGDIHQPLHVENLEVGGNLINVTFAGEDTNLHHIWDSEMPEKLVGGDTLEDAKSWAESLTEDIKSGKYKEASGKWLDGTMKNDSIASAMAWAEDANAFVCSTVVPDGADAVRDEELEGAYYDKSIPIIQMQVAKAGYRLAAWLELIATGEISFVDKDGYGQGNAGRAVNLVKRGDTRGGSAKLEDWMVEARRVRRAYGWDCGANGHRH